MEIEKLKVILELISYISIILGIPAAIYQYYNIKKKERRDREYGTYNALDEKFLEYQNLCLKYPYLNIFDIPDSTPVELNENQKKEELIAFTMLFSIFERAFLMYYDQSNDLKSKQWTGWDEYIKSFCERSNFRVAWKTSGTTFDSDFQIYIETHMNKFTR